MHPLLRCNEVKNVRTRIDSEINIIINKTINTIIGAGIDTRNLHRSINIPWPSIKTSPPFRLPFPQVHLAYAYLFASRVEILSYF